MPANTAPIYPLTPVIGWATQTTANTAMDGTGTVSTLLTAGANGIRIDKIRCKALGTNVASVLRVFVNNGSANTTAANNSLIAELTLPATTATSSAALTEYDLTLDVALPSGYKLNCAIGTTVAAGWQVTAEGGQY